MPELPDVEVFRRKLSRMGLKKKIRTVHATGSRVFHSSESTVRKHLLGNKLTKTKRHGKYLFAGISDSFFLLMHFGMTGYLHHENEIPEHTELGLDFNGKTLSYVCPRKLGRIEIIKNPGDFVRMEGLGPDVLDLEKKDFIDIFSGARGMAKTNLMNQEKVSGIGNIYSDEILYQAGINPEEDISSLGDDVLGHLYSVTKRILNTAIRNNAKTKELPKRYLNYRREAGRKCPICGAKIRKEKIGSRTAYFCPGHQV
jgi:formamidopyrimidine-DNA glycosylase